jgi:competence protein ComEA
MKKLFAFLLAVVSFIGMAFAAVNINTATQQELESLRGIGPVRAKAIIAYREKNGPFKTLEEVDKVPGIGKGTLDKIKSDVSFSGPTTSLGPDKVAQSTRPPMTPNPEGRPTARTESTTADDRKAKDADKKATPTKTADADKKADRKDDRKADDKKAPAKDAPKSGGLVDINHASQKELEALPGVGEARAKAIIKGRPYKGKDDLVAKKVVPENVYNDIKDHIVARQK